MKHSGKKHVLKRPVTRAAKKVQSWYSKSPILTLIGVLFLVIALSGTSYGAYSYLQSRDDKRAAITANQTEASLQDDIADIDDIELSEKTKTDSLKKASETKKDYSDPRAPTLTTGAGCAGIHCYTLGGFSIKVVPGTLSIRAGDSFGPITVKTVDGSRVEWGGTPSAGGQYGVHTYFNGEYRHNHQSSSFTYYGRAHERAKGTYNLSFSATKRATMQRAVVNLTVKVAPGPYFTVSVGTGSMVTPTQLSVPITINRINGYADGTNASGTITCPNNSPKSFNEWWSTYQVTKTFSVTPFSTPGKCKIKLNFSNANYIVDDLVTFTVQ